MRKRTGLRNKFRSGKGTYCKNKKRATADRYGTWVSGKRTGAEVIAGRSMTYNPGIANGTIN